MTNELILNSGNIGVNTTKKSLLKKKKKGFTLVELIAVIAILAILAAIIVPRVASYTASATTAKQKANAKTLANAIEAYNASNTNDDDDIADTDSLLAAGDIKGKLMPDYIQTWPSDSDIEAIAPVVNGTTTNETTTGAFAKGTYGALKAYISGQ